MVQLALVVLACLLLIASAIPFNAAALPGGWHYNGDVGRLGLFSVVVVANVMFQMDNTIWFGSFLFLYFLVVVVVIFRPAPRKPSLTIAEHVWNVLVVIVDIVVVDVTVVVLLSDS